MLGGGRITPILTRLAPLARAVGVIAGLAVALPGHAAVAQPLDVVAFLDKMRSVVTARQNRIATAEILNTMPLIEESYLVDGDARTRCYFDFGDLGQFIELALRGLDGVVVDPEYLDGSGHGDALAIYQNVNTLTIVATRYEAKYNGFIVLRGFTPAPGNEAEDSTQLHETIHALAFAVGRLDLDEDGPGADAPEYISNSFFEEQRILLRLEEDALTRTKAELVAIEAGIRALTDPDDETALQALVTRHLGAIHGIATTYLDRVERMHARLVKTSDHSHDKVRELMGIWGGKADWDKLIADARANVARLGEAVASIGQNDGSQPSLDSLQYFFFKRRCIPH